MKEAHSIPLKEIYSTLSSSPKGLSESQVKTLIKKYGPNKIKKKKRFKPIKVLISQFNSFLIYVLMAASLISFLVGHSIDGIIIGAIVLLNAMIGFFQQFKAEKAISRLQKLIVPMSRVVREGRQIEIPSSQLVPGDIVLFEAGDKVNADCRIIELENLETSESVLTGESLPVTKEISILKKQTSLAERKNMLFTGTSVVKGTARGIVVNTANETVFGQIAQSLQEIETAKTPMQKKLDKFSKQIGFIILGLVAIIAALGILPKFDLAEMFLTAVALAVSAIPEGLPAVLAIGFAISSLAMSKKNVVVRRLPAVESLGSVTVICSDKTGTLTEEKMTVEEVFANNKFLQKNKNKIILNKKNIEIKKSKSLSYLFKTSVLCNNSRFEKKGNKYEFIGDPTENALVEAALDLGFNKKDLIEQNPSIKKIEFDSKRKMMSVLRSNGRIKTMYTKGAISKILEKSDRELIGGQVRRLTDKRKKELIEKAHVMENKAYRVLAFAYKNISNEKEFKEESLIFTGFLGMIDPPRLEVKEAIEECRNAGIKVKIITGDSALTAKAVAEKIGITGRVVEENELRKMSDDKLEREIQEIAIFARMTPEQKLRITKILQKLGETVAITGDGVNDVLALKSADVGVAMGIRGSDVSRDVADIVLIDDNFKSIVEGVKQGRRTYDNIKKFTKYLLSVNFSEILLILFALLFSMPLPLIPIQILWINLVSDAFPALTLIFEKGEQTMKTKPRTEKSIMSGIWKFLIIAGILTFLTKLSVYLIGINKGIPIEEVRTLVLTTAIIYELLFVYTCRSKLPLSKIGLFSNKWLNIAVVGSIIAHILLVYTKLGIFFGLTKLTLENWLFILPFAFAGLIIFEIAKLIQRKSQ